MATDPAAGQPAPAPAPAPAPQAGAETVPDIQSTPDERQMAMLAHLIPIIPFVGIIGPLAIWAIKMGQSPFIEDQAKEALNFQIIVFMAQIASAISCMIWIGIVLYPAVLILNIIYAYQAGMAAKEGKVYRYPYTIRFIQ